VPPRAAKEYLTVETSSTSIVGRIFSGIRRFVCPPQAPIVAGLVGTPTRPLPPVTPLVAETWPPEGVNATAADRARVEASAALLDNLRGVVPAPVFARVMEQIAAIARAEQRFVFSVIDDADATLAARLQSFAFVEAFA
jgi:hypothetical protein